MYSDSPKIHRAPQPEIGAILGGRYRLVAVLGRGSFSVVYLARDRLTRREVALKLLPQEAAEEALWRELAALRGLRGPGLVSLLASGEDGGRPFLVLERVHGRPFPGGATPATWEALSGPLSRLLMILGGLHGRGAAHLDLKPDNIWVTPTGEVRLLDLGLAAGPAVSALSRWTSLGGNRRYAPPEQILRRPVGPSADLYAVGAMAWEALTGRLPQKSQDDPLRSAERIRVDPPSIWNLAPDLPAAVAQTLDRLVAREVDARPRSAWEALEGLGLAPKAPWVAATQVEDPLERAQLEHLFAGPKPILHLPEDAAMELERRTDGRGAWVDLELRSWVRAGLAYTTDQGVQVDRSGLDRLLAGAGADIELPEIMGEGDNALVLELVRLGWPCLTQGRLQAALGWEQDRLMRSLSQPHLHVLSSGIIRPLGRARGLVPTELRAALAAALPPACEARRRMVEGEQVTPGRAREVLRLAADRVADAQVSSTLGALDDALACARAIRPVDAAAIEIEIEALDLLTAFAVRQGTVAALDHALYERAHGQAGRSGAGEVLCHAALAVLRGEPERGLSLAAALRDVGDTLEEARLAVMRVAAGRLGQAATTQVEREALAWVERVGDPEVAARWRSWTGRRAYESEQYAEALQSYRAALEGPISVTVRLGALVGAAAAALELGEHGEVELYAVRARDLAADRRLVYYEAYATWLTRELRNRSGVRCEPDPALVAAAESLEAPALRGLLLLVEATLALRWGEREDALRWATISALSFAEDGDRRGRCVARAVAVASAGDKAGAVELATEVVEQPLQDLDWQIIAFLFHLLKAAPRKVHDEGMRLAAAAPRPRVRRELLAPEEATRVLGAAASSQRCVS